jgi:hypothetical protein
MIVGRMAGDGLVALAETHEFDHSSKYLFWRQLLREGHAIVR